MSDVDGTFEPDYEGIERDMAVSAQKLRILELEEDGARMRRLIADLYKCANADDSCDGCDLEPCGLCQDPTFSMRMLDLGIEVD